MERQYKHANTGVAGSTAIDGISNWGVGDWITFNGSAWQRIEGGADGNFVALSATGTSTLDNTAVKRTYVTDGGSLQVGGDVALGMINSQGYATASTHRWAFGPNSSANDSGKSKMWSFFVNKPSDPGQNSEVQLQTYTGFNNSIANGAIPSTNWATYLRMTLGGALNPGSNNTQTIGSATYRWSEIFCTNAVINTSDANDKTEIEPLSDAEQRVAIKLKSLIKKFKFKDAVELKGEGARIHVGVMAQDVQQAFVDEGLDPERYSVFCSDTWHEYNGQPVQVDDEGRYIEVHWELNGSVIEADEEGILPDGAQMVKTYHQTTQVTKLGVRYNELFAFVLSAI